MKATRSALGRGFLSRVRGAVQVWWNALPGILLLTAALMIPATWSLGVLLRGGTGQGHPGAASGAEWDRAFEWLVALGVQLGCGAMGASGVISALAAARANRKSWVSRGLRKSPRILGWEILVLVQSAIRFVLPFLPPPAGARPDQFHAAPGTAARAMERLPVLSGLIFYFAKFGLRRYVAVLTSDPWHETAAVTRGAWIHVGSLSLVSEAIGAAALGILGNAQRAAAGGTGLPGWGVLLGVLFASQLIMSILEAYGLLLYEDLRGAEMQAEDVKRKA